MPDFYSFLQQELEEARAASASSREDVFEAARASLLRLAAARRPRMSIEEYRLHKDDLEAAIAQIQTEFAARADSYTADGAPETEADQRELSPTQHVAEVAEGEPEFEAPQRHFASEEDTGEAVAILPDEPVEEAVDLDAGVLRGEDRFEIDAPPPARGESPRREVVVAVDMGQHPMPARVYDADVELERWRPRDAEPRPAPSLTSRLVASTAIPIQLTIASFAGVAIYAYLSERGLPFQQAAVTPPTPPPAAPPAPVAAPPAPSAEPAEITLPGSGHPIPLPTMFGVYAIRDGRLLELEQIATSAPDPRARNLHQITTPPRTLFADGKLSFVLFRRDLTTNAPDRVPVRIAAKIARMTSFDTNGETVTAPPKTDTWFVRDVGFDLRVQPVRDHPEMVIAQPADPAFVVSPGRYALAFAGQHYDFSVEGPVVAPTHCVEGMASVQGPVFYECPALDPRSNRASNALRPNATGGFKSPD